jgi:hypothetical protein
MYSHCIIIRDFQNFEDAPPCGEILPNGCIWIAR